MPGSLRARLEQLIGDAYLDVVGLAGKHQQRLVLRLPSKAADRAVVPIFIDLSRYRVARQHDICLAVNPVSRFLISGGRTIEICNDRRVWICSISPAPKSGVGMRNIKLLAAIACAKFGCDNLHDTAPVIPAIVNRSCTPPSDGNRASRTGPVAVMNFGRLFVVWLRLFV